MQKNEPPSIPITPRAQPRPRGRASRSAAETTTLVTLPGKDPSEPPPLRRAVPTTDSLPSTGAAPRAKTKSPGGQPANPSPASSTPRSRSRSRIRKQKSGTLYRLTVALLSAAAFFLPWLLADWIHG